MGVYHLMGLGLSPGVVTAPLSYLGWRYQRWDAGDRRFFRRSGERRQRREGGKVGDVEAIVIFTTRAVLAAAEGSDRGIPCRKYLDNRAGSSRGSEEEPGPMRPILVRLLEGVWPEAAGGRRAGRLFWCEVPRRDMGTIYARVLRVVAALAGVGGQGKEMWINLTGGSNIQNLALLVAAFLSGRVARAYYVQAASPAEERCVRVPRFDEDFWADLPVLPLSLDAVSTGILGSVEEDARSVDELWSRSTQRHWNEVEGLDQSEFYERYLRRLWSTGLIEEVEDGYVAGPRWETSRPYVEAWDRAREETAPLERVTAEKDWLEVEEVRFDGP